MKPRKLGGVKAAWLKRVEELLEGKRLTNESILAHIAEGRRSGYSDLQINALLERYLDQFNFKHARFKNNRVIAMVLLQFLIYKRIPLKLKELVEKLNETLVEGYKLPREKVPPYWKVCQVLRDLQFNNCVRQPAGFKHGYYQINGLISTDESTEELVIQPVAARRGYPRSVVVDGERIILLTSA